MSAAQYTPGPMPLGYRVEYRPGDPVFMKPQDFGASAKAGYDGGAVWPLFAEPQPGCKAEVEVHLGWCWVQPRYASAVRSLTGFIPLYRGPQIQSAQIDEVVALLFPSILEPEPGDWMEARAALANAKEGGAS